MSLIARGVAIHDPATEAFFTDAPLVAPMATEWREREAWRERWVNHVIVEVNGPAVWKPQAE
jgi:hypothetical protein